MNKGQYKLEINKDQYKLEINKDQYMYKDILNEHQKDYYLMRAIITLDL